METFTAKTFNIKDLVGISKKNIEEHLKLYIGYVSNSNLVLNKINEYEKNSSLNSYLINELRRRFSFEFDGMRNHEYYFSSFEGGYKDINKDSLLFKEITKNGVEFDLWLENFKNIAMTRGVGWAMLYYDKRNNKLLTQWVDEQHIGHLVGLPPILCLDMWEHAFVYDYPTSDKRKYIDAFFKNINWGVIEENFNKLN